MTLPRFSYRAVMRDGNVSSGSLEAADRHEALARVSAMSRAVISLKPSRVIPLPDTDDFAP